MIDDTAAFAGTMNVPDHHALDTDAVAAWMRAHVKGCYGPLAIEQCRGGQFNP